LIGADFSSANIRGCDFTNALLQDANFNQVKAGQTLGHLVIMIMTAVVVAIATLHAISQILFGLLGVTPEELAWIYTLTFFFTLAIVTVASAVMGITNFYLLIIKTINNLRQN